MRHALGEIPRVVHPMSTAPPVTTTSSSTPESTTSSGQPGHRRGSLEQRVPVYRVRVRGLTEARSTPLCFRDAEGQVQVPAASPGERKSVQDARIRCFDASRIGWPADGTASAASTCSADGDQTYRLAAGTDMHRIVSKPAPTRSASAPAARTASVRSKVGRDHQDQLRRRAALSSVSGCESIAAHSV